MRISGARWATGLEVGVTEGVESDGQITPGLATRVKKKDFSHVNDDVLNHGPRKFMPLIWTLGTVRAGRGF